MHILFRSHILECAHSIQPVPGKIKLEIVIRMEIKIETQKIWVSFQMKRFMKRSLGGLLWILFSENDFRSDDGFASHHSGNGPRILGLFSNETFSKRPRTIFQESDFHSINLFESHTSGNRRGGGLGSSTIVKKFNEPYAPS